MGDCNNTSVIIVIGADAKLKYVHKGPLRGADVEAATKLVETLVNELKAPAAPVAEPANIAPVVPAP